MKKTSPAKIQPPDDDELLPEYRFGYSKARANRFAKPGSCFVSLEPDAAQVFTTSEEVNAVLRALIATMPERSHNER